MEGSTGPEPSVSGHKRRGGGDRDDPGAKDHAAVAPSHARNEPEAACQPPPPAPLVPMPSKLCCESAVKYYGMYQACHAEMTAQQRRHENSPRQEDRRSSLDSSEKGLQSCVANMIGHGDDGSVAYAPVRNASDKLLTSIRTLLKLEARTETEAAALKRQRAATEENLLRLRQMQEALVSTVWPVLQFPSEHAEPAKLQQRSRRKESGAPVAPARVTDKDGDAIDLLPSTFHSIFGDAVYLETKTAAPRPSQAASRRAIQQALQAIPGVGHNGTAAGKLPEFALFGPKCASVGGVNMKVTVMSRKLTLAAQYAGQHGRIPDFFLHLQVLLAQTLERTCACQCFRGGSV